MTYEIKRFPYDGTVDADGHILEPADLWENYLEKKYLDRALRIQVDDDGLEYLEINGQPSRRTTKGSLAIMGAMGEENLRPITLGQRRAVTVFENIPIAFINLTQSAWVIQGRNADNFP